MQQVYLLIERSLPVFNASPPTNPTSFLPHSAKQKPSFWSEGETVNWPVGEASGIRVYDFAYMLLRIQVHWPACIRQLCQLR